MDLLDDAQAGEEADLGAGPDYFTAALRSALIAVPAAAKLTANPAAIRQLDRQAVRRAFRLNDWMLRVLGGVEEVPASLADVGGPDGFMRQLIATLPTAFPADEDSEPFTLDSVIDETVDDWRSAAADIGARIRLIDLQRSALGTRGISADQKRELLVAYAGLAGFQPTTELAASEIAERVQPLLRASLESDLARLDAWPARPGALAGLYARAVLVAWASIAEESPPLNCTTLGCANLIPPTRNRRYCESCLRRRKAAKVRDIRARRTKAR